MDKWDPQEALDKIERYQVTHTHMVPTQLHRMLQLPDDVKSRFDVSSMRWAIHAAAPCPIDVKRKMLRSEEHTSELQSLMRISYAVFCLKKKKTNNTNSP